MAGTQRVGINMQRQRNHVRIHSVLLDSPAALQVCKGEVLVAVNGQPVGSDAAAAQRMLQAATSQCTATGRVLPVRLTLGSLALASPKGIDELDLSLDVGGNAVDISDGEPDVRRAPPLDEREVVQSL